MHLLISYRDGSTETAEARLEADVVLAGGSWKPGIVVASPDRCYFKADYFTMAVNEGGERNGSEAPMADDGEDPDAFEPFEWQVVGTEEDECRAKLAAWSEAAGEGFDPDADADAAIPDAPSDIKEEYMRDRDCWLAYLADPHAELSALRTAGPRP